MKKHLLLLHGALGSSTQFDLITSELQNYFIVHAFDLRGHGKNAADDEFTLAALTSDVKIYIEENNINELHIFGYSLGGYIALKLAVEKYSKLKSILTLATKLDWNIETAAIECSKLNPEKMLEKIPVYAVALKSLHGENWNKTVINTAALIRKIGVNPITAEQFESIECPVRLAVGDDDNMVSIEETLNIKHKIKFASIAVLPSTQHPFEKINAQRLLFEIKSFFVQ
jgi:pimeloyl-ACP methyl ester carboxylesterase